MLKLRRLVVGLMTIGVSATIYTCPSLAQVGFGPNPTLPPPEPTGYIPTINIAKAVGWPEGVKPEPAPGLEVTAFATDLDHPRWLYTLPNGDVLVAETNEPPRPTPSSIRGLVVSFIMGRVGAGVPSANRITLLRDTDGDGIADIRSTFLEGLNSPFGMALIDNAFYVANTDSLVRYAYTNGATKIDDPGTKIADLPSTAPNSHWTKNVVANMDGSRLYVSVGSNSNSGEGGMDNEINRAAILEIDPSSGETRLFASGLRNPVGLAWEPVTKALWTAVNERDALGDDVVPDYMTSVQEGAFYGWPYSYFGQTLDPRVKPQRPDLVETAIPPDYALGAHTASLGLMFYRSNLLPSEYHGGAFIGQHGSWNRSEPVGYKVVFVPFKNGTPAGMPRDVLTGFLDEDGDAQGRPVGVTEDQHGALLVADDVGNVIWRVGPIQ